jgi:hypothetical protein
VRLARLSFSLPCATDVHEEAKVGTMKFFKQLIITFVASSVLAAGVMAFEPQKEQKPPPPPKEKQDVPKPPKENPPPRGGNDNKGGGDKKGGKP